MNIRKTKLVVMIGFLLLLPGLLMLGAPTNAQKKRTGAAAPKAAQPAAQFKACPVCNGSGKTHEHVAKYEEVRCYNCAGKGETLCEARSGWPHSDDYYKDGRRWICLKCNGNGRVRCSVCGGSGVRNVDRGYEKTKVCHNCKGSGRIQLTREEIRAKEEARLEAERRRAEEARLEAERVERAERERVRLEADRKRLEEARNKELELARASNKPAIAAANSFAPSFKNLVGMELILVKPGEFRMGDDGGDANEKPVHVVVINKPFYLGKYEVTQAQWRAVMGNNPSQFKGDDLPVENVSFNDAKEFCERLSQMTGQKYRLPSEAEWEYACRAGTNETYAGDLEVVAWYSKNAGDKTHPVGQKRPNGFGLFDMHGNVWEWCEDFYRSNYDGAPFDGSPWLDSSHLFKPRVLRGGAWFFNSSYARSAKRLGNDPSARLPYFGVRVAM